MHSFAPLTLRLHPSRRLRAFLVVAHGLAGVSVILADVPIWLALLLAAAIAPFVYDGDQELEIRGVFQFGGWRRVGSGEAAENFGALRGVHLDCRAQRFILLLLWLRSSFSRRSGSRAG